MKPRLIAALAATLLAGAASAQTYPSKPVIIIPGQPGGGGFTQLQFMRELLTTRLGQPVVLDARPANLMGGTLARAQPDGYTLLAAGDTVWFAPLLAKTDYDTLKDFAPVTGVGIQPLILVVNPAVKANSVKELIALAKARPGTLNYSSAGLGSSYQIAGELFKSMSGTDIVGVPYVGAGPTTQAVVSGEVQMTFAPSATVVQLIQAGKMRALAHTASKPTPLAPDLPAIASSGLAGYEWTTSNSLFAPAKTPAAIIRRLNQDFVWVLDQKEIKDKFITVGAEVNPSTPEELGATVKKKYEQVAKLIKVAGISAN